jgi:hypothetical protein
MPAARLYARFCLPLCPSLGSAAEDNVCLCDDPRSLHRGVYAVVLPTGSDSRM